jgi:hypothetical protein
MLSAKRSLDRAIDRLQAAELRLEPADVVEGEGGADLEAARHDFADAYSNMNSIFVAPLRVLPVVGRHVNAVRAMSGSAEHTVEIAEDARREMRSVLTKGWDQRAQRVPSMLAFRDIAAHALGELHDLDLGPGDALIGPVARARGRFEEKLTEARQLLRRARSAADGMATFLQGPTRYLVLAANNAEMRAGSGMVLNVSVITAENGHVVQESNQSTGELQLPSGAVPLQPGDLTGRWGWLLPNEDWRNLASTPNFEETAELATRMWQAQTGQTVDGVLLVDPFALRALLATSGPIAVDDVTLDADNVIQYILHDQYLGLDAVGDNEARRDRLGDIADEAVQHFDQGDWKLSTLLRELRSVVDQRHVLAWSVNKKEDAAWKAAGVGGSLHPDSLMVSVMNFGGNKLDQYLGVDAQLDVTPAADATSVRLTITLTNRAPENDPGYILGGRSPGTYSGILAVDVPGYAFDPRIDGTDELVARGKEGATTVVAGKIRLERGEARTFTVTFTLPPQVTGLDVEPSARYPAVEWRSGSGAWSSGGAHRVTW